MSRSASRRALVSVSNKAELGPFVERLVQLGFEIVSTGGTRRFLEEQGVPVIDVSSYTGFPEIMQGRVKTLHPKVHGAILGRPNRPDDIQAMSAHGIIPFELVVCNLYPFEETVAKDGVSDEEAVEQIDIGGPSMLRAAAKNFAHVAVVTDPAQYARVLSALEAGPLPVEFRRELAAAAFERTAEYDRAIADYMSARSTDDSSDPSGLFPPTLLLRFSRRSLLRYGENPHQAAAFYEEPPLPAGSLAAAETLHGKQLSYNNLLDLDSALSLVGEFDRPAAVIIKHNNPCGCGVAETQAEAFSKAYRGDPVSAFGSILGFNAPLDLATAHQLCEPDRFIEAIIAPDYDADAFDALVTRPKWRKNVRLLRCRGLADRSPSHLEYRRISGGLLVQQPDALPEAVDDWKCVTRRSPTDAEAADLAFAWLVCKHVKSNAIVYAKEGTVLGVGAGQMSRLDSTRIAGDKAGQRSQGAVAASDAFFPFRDAIDEAAQAGIRAIIQPGGSRGDDSVIAACDEHDMTMIFTGRRHFRH